MNEIMIVCFVVGLTVSWIPLILQIIWTRHVLRTFMNRFCVVQQPTILPASPTIYIVPTHDEVDDWWKQDGPRPYGDPQ